MRIAIWVLPLALLLSQTSLWAAAAAIFAGWYGCKSAGVSWYEPLSSDVFASFHALDSLHSVPSLAAVCSAACVQSGVSSAFAEWPVASAGLLGTGAALAAWLTNPFRLPDAPLPARRPRALAAILTVIGLLHYLPSGQGGGALAKGVPEESAAPPANQGALEGAYDGVILMPEVSSHPVLIPPLPFLRKSLFSEKQTTPLSVPFFGVYWMYRWPLDRPPANAHIARGSPLTSVFRSVDRNALQMDAHQNFGTLIDLDCCSKIQLVVRSVDGPVSLSLVLTNTTFPGKPSQSLGEFTVDSTVDRPRAGNAPVQSLLSFAVPSSPRIREFDEATIRFRRPSAKASAKVAIDRFVFVPRGR